MDISPILLPTGSDENDGDAPIVVTVRSYEYEAIIQSADTIGQSTGTDADGAHRKTSGGAFVAFPYDIRTEFGRGRVKVHATFDGEPYDGSIVNMGVKNPDGTICYIIGIRKDIRARIGKQIGDTVQVTIIEL